MEPLFFLTMSLMCMSSLALRIEHHYQSIRDECPAQEEIPKCSCSAESDGLYVLCENMGTDSDLQNHLKFLRGHSVKVLEISDVNATSLSTDIWKGLEAEYLSLKYFNVQDASFRPGKRHFQGLEKSLQRLEIYKSFSKGDRPLLNLQLDHLENLNEAIFEYNDIPEVGNDWFTSGPKEMNVLIFEGNMIQELGDRAFSSLNNLRFLVVANNHINSISRTMLPASPNVLRTIEFSYNKIRTLPTDIFSGMPLLEEVNLDHNLIHTVREDTWGSIVSQLQLLSLEGNMLHCDEDLKWLCGTTLENTLASNECRAPVQEKGSSVKQFCSREMYY